MAAPPAESMKPEFVYERLASYTKSFLDSEECAELNVYIQELRTSSPLMRLAKANETRVKLLTILQKYDKADRDTADHTLQRDEEDLIDLIKSVTKPRDVAQEEILSEESTASITFFLRHLCTHSLLRPFAHRLLRRLGTKENATRWGKGIQVDADYVNNLHSSTIFSDVYRGMSCGKPVAVKRIKIGCGGDPLSFEKFLQEESLWGLFLHPNIVQLKGIFEDERFQLCMVSPWMENGMIRTYVSNRELSFLKRTKLLIQIGGALEFIHGHDIIHGDLRGPNILIDDEENAQITDFGLSTIVDATLLDPMAGSRAWLAPELQRIGETGASDSFRRTKATDVFSFAMVCIEVYTGNVPFPELWRNRNRDYQIKDKILAGERPDQPVILKDKGKEPWTCIQTAWHNNARERHSAGILRNIFASLLSDSSKELEAPSDADEKAHEKDHNLVHRLTLRSQAPEYGGDFSDIFSAFYHEHPSARPFKVALKVFRSYRRRVHENSQPLDWLRTLREHAQQWARIRHKNCQLFYGYASVPGLSSVCLVSKWCEPHQWIDSYIEEENPDESQRLSFIHGIASGLEHLHAEAIIHGHLVINNIMIDGTPPEVFPRICDFGRYLVEDGIGESRSSSQVNGSAYDAPELYQTEDEGNPPQHTCKSDVFSYAFLAYQILTSREPYGQSRGMRALYMVSNGKRPSKPNGLTNINIWALISRCWDPLPSVRPESGEIVAQLGGYL